jgi:hypothetical protein
VHQPVIRISRDLCFLRGEWLDGIAIQERTHLPSLRAVVDLYRGLACELDLKPRLVRALDPQCEWQLHLFVSLRLVSGGDRRSEYCIADRRSGTARDAHGPRLRVARPRIHLAAERHGLHRTPGRQPTASRNVFVDNLRRRQVDARQRLRRR